MNRCLRLSSLSCRCASTYLLPQVHQPYHSISSTPSLFLRWFWTIFIQCSLLGKTRNGTPSSYSLWCALISTDPVVPSIEWFLDFEMETTPLSEFKYTFYDYHLIYSRFFACNPIIRPRMIQNVYHPAKDSWLRARGLIKDSEDGLIVRYRDLMANENLIQIYVCLAYARRFLNQDVLSPLFYRGRSTLLPDGLKPVELLLGSKTSDDDETDFQSYQVMQDDRMHRLFMPLTCAIKLCDTVPPRLAQHVARYIANIGPYCATSEKILSIIYFFPLNFFGGIFQYRCFSNIRKICKTTSIRHTLFRKCVPSFFFTLIEIRRVFFALKNRRFGQDGWSYHST